VSEFGSMTAGALMDWGVLRAFAYFYVHSYVGGGSAYGPTVSHCIGNEAAVLCCYERNGTKTQDLLHAR
jgi:hypothetical protein